MLVAFSSAIAAVSNISCFLGTTTLDHTHPPHLHHPVYIFSPNTDETTLVVFKSGALNKNIASISMSYHPCTRWWRLYGYDLKMNITARY